MHCESPIKRRPSRKIWVGSVPVGGDAPIAVQSMTNTDTCDVAATVAQIAYLRLRHGKVEPMQWVSLGVIVVFGGATLLGG